MYILSWPLNKAGNNNWLGVNFELSLVVVMNSSQLVIMGSD